MKILRIEEIDQLPEEKLKKLIQFFREEKIPFKLFEMNYIGKK